MRELRQHASRYLALVAGGERIEVTDRSRPVAMLVPLRGNRWEDLMASGRVTPPPAGHGDVADEPPGEYGIDASEVLQSMRDADR